MPPPPPAITTVPRRASASTREMSTIWRGLGEGTTWRQPRPESSRISQPSSAPMPFACSSVKNGPIGLVGIGEGRIVGVDLHLRQQAGDVALAVGLAQRVLQRLHQ